MMSLPQVVFSAFNALAVNLFSHRIGQVRLKASAVRCVPVLILLLLLVGASKTGWAQAASAVHGKVVDARGSALADAAVRLERDDHSVATTSKSGQDGSFTFDAVTAGSYAVVAEKSAIRSSAVQVVVPGNGAQESIVVVLDLGKAPGAAPNASAKTMEFADNPNFTIAGVTDWTAAGGHGSDVSLRTSEALNRETLTLKPDGSGAGTPNLAAEAHLEAGTAAEASGDPLRAVREFALAVEKDPSERNYFAWGEELLQHRAVLQAKEVFEQGVKRYPKSLRLVTSLGAALFAGALYEQSAERLCEASDLDPREPEPYQFMGKIEVVAPHFDSCMDARLARYAELNPNDALANYFYAMDLWRQEGPALDAETRKRVETLLAKAVTIDAKCSDGFLQLGNLKSSEKDYPAAIGFYTKAIGVDPQSSEAHYRLGVAYDRMGEREKAKQEFAAHDALNQQQAVETERQRKEIKQFVVDMQSGPKAQ